MKWNCDIQDLYNKEFERKKNLPLMRRKYEEYKRKFIKNGGFESDYELLSYETFKELQETDY